MQSLSGKDFRALTARIRTCQNWFSLGSACFPAPSCCKKMQLTDPTDLRASQHSDNDKSSSNMDGQGLCLICFFNA